VGQLYVAEIKPYHYASVFEEGAAVIVTSPSHSGIFNPARAMRNPFAADRDQRACRVDRQGHSRNVFPHARNDEETVALIAGGTASARPTARVIRR
jgi:hypothetical protein